MESSSSSSSHHSSNAPRSVWLRTTMTSASVVALEEQLEKDNMQREKEWLLSNEVPFVCKEIKTLIEKTLELISFPNYQQLQRKKKADPEKGSQDIPLSKIPRADPNAASQDSQTLPFESEESILKGFLRIEGWNIAEAEVSVRSPRWNKSALYKSSISPSHPLRLSQMYNFFNFLRLGLDAILKLEKLLSVHQIPNIPQQPSNATKGTQNTTSNASTNDIAYIKKIIEEVSNYLKSANEEFVFQRRNLFPDSPISFTSTIFQPQVPQDLVIEFGISNQELIMTIYCLHVFNSKPTKMTKHTNPPQVGQVCQYNHEGNQVWVEIVDKTQVHLQVNKINTAFLFTNTCLS